MRGIFVFLQRGCLALKQHFAPVGARVSVSDRRSEDTREHLMREELSSRASNGGRGKKVKGLWYYV